VRWLLVFCSVFVAVIWFAPERVVAGGIVASSATTDGDAAVDPLSHAQALEEALRAVEWYTNESVRKALQAEAIGDITNAKLFGDKAIESDKKAQGLRSETAAAWLSVNESSNEQAVWQRAALMAEERALMLANRIPSLSARWEAARRLPVAPVATKPVVPALGVAATSVQPATSASELEIIYLQSVFLTAQQWAVAADFYSRAKESDKATNAREQLQAQLPALPVKRLQVLGETDVRLKETAQQVQVWIAPTASSQYHP